MRKDAELLDRNTDERFCKLDIVMDISPFNYAINNEIISHKYINTIFPSYIRLNKQVTVSHKFINTIFPTYIRLNQQVNVSHKFINTIFPSYIRLNKQV